jgi:hypothetical protein
MVAAVTNVTRPGGQTNRSVWMVGGREELGKRTLIYASKKDSEGRIVAEHNCIIVDREGIEVKASGGSEAPAESVTAIALREAVG